MLGTKGESGNACGIPQVVDFPGLAPTAGAQQMSGIFGAGYIGGNNLWGPQTFPADFATSVDFLYMNYTGCGASGTSPVAFGEVEEKIHKENFRVFREMRRNIFIQNFDIVSRVVFLIFLVQN